MGKEIWAAYSGQERQLCRSREKRKLLGCWCNLVKKTQYSVWDSQNLLTMVLCNPVHCIVASFFSNQQRLKPKILVNHPVEFECPVVDLDVLELEVLGHVLHKMSHLRSLLHCYTTSAKQNSPQKFTLMLSWLHPLQFCTTTADISYHDTWYRCTGN